MALIQSLLCACVSTAVGDPRHLQPTRLPGSSVLPLLLCLILPWMRGHRQQRHPPVVFCLVWPALVPSSCFSLTSSSFPPPHLHLSPSYSDAEYLNHTCMTYKHAAPWELNLCKDWWSKSVSVCTHAVYSLVNTCKHLNTETFFLLLN